MFEFFLWGVLIICAGGFALAYTRTRDCFHPLVIVLPMLAVLYWFMPWYLVSNGFLDIYLDMEQRDFVQLIYFCGVAAFILGCLAGSGLHRTSLGRPVRLASILAHPSIRMAGYVVGAIGFIGWCITIEGVGGLSAAFGQAYGSGWSNYGYLRETPLALLPALLLLMPSVLQKKRTPGLKVAIGLFAFPSVIQGILGARRGPTFMIFSVLGMAWYLYRDRRPPFFKMIAGACLLGYLVLFLVMNRQQIYIGSTFSNLDFSPGSVLVDTSSGNEYVYGSGSILNSETTGHFFWGRRYLAEILVRPIPRQMWPNKYADFGVPELEVNAGTGGPIFHQTMGWAAPVGAAPGMVADQWIEYRWLCFPALALIGWLFGRCWRNAVEKKGFWILQYIVTVALSLYFVMQTMESVIFRFLILSIPIWCASYLVHRNSQITARQVIYRRGRAGYVSAPSAIYPG